MTQPIDGALTHASADHLPRPAPLPDGSVLLHIGPPKTGTTALQASFWAARRVALAQGVRYAGRRRHSVGAVRSVVGNRARAGRRGIGPDSQWEVFAREVREAREPRVVVSSEAFAHAPEDAIQGIVHDLGGDRVWVVATLRPIPSLLASAWQEDVQHGRSVGFDDWLRAVLRDPDSEAGRRFWLRQRHDQLLARWAAATTPDQVVAVVLDDADRGRLYQVFEGLTGLAQGTLTPVESVDNRSLTLTEVTVLGALARRYAAEGLDMSAFHRIGRQIVAQHLKRRSPQPDEPRIETPQWALDAAGEVARDVVSAVAASGVRVIGDLDMLTVVPRSRLTGEEPQAVDVSPDLTAEIAISLILGAHRVARWVPRRGARGSAAVMGRSATAPESGPRTARSRAARLVRALRRLLRRVARPLRGGGRPRDRRRQSGPRPPE